jgi:hypothetical protein
MSIGAAAVLVCLPSDIEALSLNSGILQTTQWALIIVATAVIGARLYLRLHIQKRRLLTSDYFMCAAWVTSIMSAAVDLKFLELEALDPDLQSTLVNYKSTPEDIVLVLKVRIRWFQEDAG